MTAQTPTTLLETPIALSPLPERPLVSVLIANYNYGHYVSGVIESVLNQSYSNFEVIVVDDVSTDNSCAVIEQYTGYDARVRLLRHTQNGGQAAAWYTGYRQSTGDIICLLDADDYFAPNKLALLVECFSRHPRSGFALHPMTVVDEQGRFVQQAPFMGRFEEGWIADQVIRRGGRLQAMPTSALAFRRELAECLFPIPEVTRDESERSGAADGVIYTLAPLLTELTVINEPLTSYRVHSQNSLSSADRDRRQILQKQVTAIASQIDRVNTRLRELGLESNQIDLNRNLTYRHQRFALALAEGQPRVGLVSDFFRLLPAVLRDDLYSWPNKMLRLFGYGLAIPLPLPLRSYWLSFAFGQNRLKPLVQKGLKQVRGAAH